LKNTLYLKVDPKQPEPEKIQTAANIIKQGGLVAFPTETVYGLGANAKNGTAISALFAAKKRPVDNPPIIHVADPKQVSELTEEIPKVASALMQRFWPGPLTLVFKRSSNVPKEAVASLDTIAIRMPNHPVALALIKQSGCPIAAPSANLSGKPSPTSAQHVLDDLNGRIDAVIDGGATSVGVESTVLDLSVEPPMLLRPGGTSLEALREVLGTVVVHPFVASEKEVTLKEARSPGMRHKHYAPKAQVILIEGQQDAVEKKIRELTKVYRDSGCKVGVLVTAETAGKVEADVVKLMGSRDDLESVARSLFGLLREFDVEGVDVIVAEGVSIEGLGLAVMNRLRKASGYHIIKA
jgi:L-threonylcarbamoyladenylate synthase